jgi:hypothetical protein
MGIQSALRGIMLLAGRRRRGEGNCSGARPAVGPTRVGTDHADAFEKIVRASLVADEWDGTIALLARRAPAPAG